MEGPVKHQRMRYGHVLRLDAGEEIVESLRAFAREHGVRAAALSGLGACGETELGFFDPGTRSYVRRRFDGDHEIVALTGNLSDLEGEPFPHCHLVIAGRDFVAHGGHLFRAVVSVTCEIQVVSDPEVLRRVRRDDLGFHPLDPGAR
jgi:predicted DNA-binding protein with PD1-like motif